MSALHKGTSDKLHVIDRKTFENIKQNQNTENDDPFRKIKNAKFRKKSAVKSGDRATFNLFQYLTKTSKEKKKEIQFKYRTVYKSGNRSHKIWKPRGKTREGGKRKKYTKLKKAILSYRRQKSQNQPKNDLNAELLQETVHLIKSLSIDSQEKEKETQKVAVSNELEPTHELVKSIHSRRFRSYCDNCTTPLLIELTEQLIRELDRFQKRAVAQNAIKAHAHRRFVVGFREANNFLLVKKVKLIIIAPDCEKCDGEDGLDEKISNIKKQCQQQSVPYIFSLRRRQLAYALFKKAPVGCVAVLDFDGAREIFLKLLQALEIARKSYEDLTNKVK
ncbi:selenocysteine insertion sequence-binding protein 2 [Zeugodacus cucurbitae]|uniref:selenocysteine insertion sequence-binding protein 2 n=1 Tax=Zeugodacus cucurbitae TaxID=28588 RepID=UPI00059696E4|nr:selenocysteine insertion sequence-binding protein 2 [Zeugodacus cucurbitae]XP_054084404.1 selenocysteine insertion sequence-binding protein 2 [Zeugodacus cucurbitae]